MVSLGRRLLIVSVVLVVKVQPNANAKSEHIRVSHVTGAASIAELTGGR